jgi:hypothetical protein
MYAACIPLEQQGRIQIGVGSPQAHQPRNPPGHDHEQGQGPFQSLHTSELQSFHAAAVLENVEQQFDFPARPVPVNQFGCRCKGVDRPIRQQSPLHRLHPLRGAFFAGHQAAHLNPALKPPFFEPGLPGSEVLST